MKFDFDDVNQTALVITAMIAIVALLIFAAVMDGQYITKHCQLTGRNDTHIETSYMTIALDDEVTDYEYFCQNDDGTTKFIWRRYVANVPTVDIQN